MRDRQPVLVDSSVWVEAFRTGGDPEVGDEYRRVMLADRGVTCDIIVAEVLQGARFPAEFERLRRDLLVIPCLAMTASIGLRMGEWGYKLASKGITVASADLIIATLAVENDALLLHRDKHFEAMAEVMGLACRTAGA
jgi:predicted nucleic acid-binding protein